MDQERITLVPDRVIFRRMAPPLAVTVTVALALLLGFKSTVVEVTLAELVKVPTMLA